MNYTNGLPKGAVIMWHGEVEDIPDGWAICDGKDGLTPDLRSRFVVGAGNSYNLNDSGGENKVQLSISEMPNHKHDLRRSNDASNEKQGWIGTNKTYFPAIWATDREGNLSNEPMSTSGGNQPHENRPPFYALFFIKRII